MVQLPTRSCKLETEYGDMYCLYKGRAQKELQYIMLLNKTHIFIKLNFIHLSYIELRCILVHLCQKIQLFLLLS